MRTGTAASGELGQCRNNPGCTDIEDIGPVPIDTYDMIASPKYDGSWRLQPNLWKRYLYSNGKARGGFFLHLGFGISHGCITVIKTDPIAKAQFEAVRDILNWDATNTMTVTP